MKPVRDILKHSGIYAVGQILSRVASLLLLPLYTRVLTPADYGCVAILDLTAGILAVFLGAGMASAVTRFHFDTEHEDERRRVWWTGLIYLACASAVLVVPMWFARGWIADVTLGSDIADGAKFYTLALATLVLGAFSEVFDAYLRVRKWSGIYISLSLSRLLANVVLNVYFLVELQWGITGLLLGNLLASAFNTLLMFAIFISFNRKPQACAESETIDESGARACGVRLNDRQLARKLLAFGSPLIATAVLSMVIHEADRYFLRAYVDLDQVGIYSLAYKIGQAVNMLCLVPFAAIWGVVVYEIAKQPDAKKQYAAVFEQFVAGLSLVMLGASLFVKPVLGVLTTSDYSAAADLVPVICLAYLCFSLHEHFRVPVLLSRQTLSLVPVYGFAALLNVACNLVLIPRWHAEGAAWASVITYAGFSFFGLLRYRKIDAYPYSFRRSGEIVIGMIFTWTACRLTWDVSLLAGWTMSVAAWLAWAALLFGRPALDYILHHRRVAPMVSVLPNVPTQNLTQ